MTIEEFAEKLFNENDLDEAYVAILWRDGQWDLEVEVSGDEIVGIYETGASERETAIGLADDLDNALRAHGIVVYSTRPSWSEHLDDLAVNEESKNGSE